MHQLLFFKLQYTGAYQEGGRLVIPECRPSYGGQYVCTIYLVNGNQKIAYATLVVEDDERGEGVVQR